MVVRLPLDITLFRDSDFKKQPVEVSDAKVVASQENTDVVENVEERLQNENKKKSC